MLLHFLFVPFSEKRKIFILIFIDLQIFLYKTGSVVVALSIDYADRFLADHPFFFIIATKKIVVFSGKFYSESDVIPLRERKL